MQNFFKMIKRIWLIINYKTILLTSLSVFSTWLCLEQAWLADYPLTLIATAVVFPVVFSIGGAYKRREVALAKYSTIKSHGYAIYLALRDWMPQENNEALQECRTTLGNLIRHCAFLFTHDRRNMSDNEKPVYQEFSRLSRFIKQQLREQGMNVSEVSRCNQYLSKMINAFEDIKHIYQYRTPRSLRAFSGFFITVLPVLYGPYFASLAQEYSPQLTYIMPVLFSFVLVSLYNIQDHLENPFDQLGVDDIEFNSERYLQRLELQE